MSVPDNYDAFRQHQAEQDAWLERRPKCCNCGERIQDDFLFDIGGDLYCENCIKKEFRQSTEDYER
jgi:late competence protein required for DNA uptake (superfamily II DNA/RNA helicase)